MTVLLFTILTLSVLGILSAVILYFVARKFKVCLLYTSDAADD